VKDCVIVEEIMELTRATAGNGFAGKCVFCTSNMKDYGDQNGNFIQPWTPNSARSTFDSPPNLPWAVHEIRIEDAPASPRG